MFAWIHSLWLKVKPGLSGQLDAWIDSGVAPLAEFIDKYKAEIIRRLNEFDSKTNAEYFTKIVKDYKNRQL